VRLTRKLIFALTAATIVIVAISALLRVRREVALFDEDMRRDDILVGRILARAVGDAWKAGGEPAAQAIIRDAGLTAGHLQVRWGWLDAGDEAGWKLSDDTLARARTGEVVAQKVADGRDGHLDTLVPVRTPDGRLGGLEITEPLTDERAYIRRTVRQSLVATAVLLGALTGAALLLGIVFIGRPTRALMDKARRIAAGDLGGPLVLRQRDELGDLGNELNRMCEQLSTAAMAAQRATESRVAAIDQLRHADRLTTVGQLASGVAHELGTPLNVISGRAQMIADGELEVAEARDSARIIHEQAGRMAAIVRQLLDFSRSGAPRGREAVRLRGVATRSLALLETMARHKGVAMSLADGGDDLSAWADDHALQQALLNLMVNAIHATPAGGRVVVEVDEVVATPPAERGGGPTGPWARVRVTDTGAGIDRATRARIFEPFFTTKGIGEGTGLGLSVTYGIVHELGGWIDVESEPGRGSVFALLVPLAPAEARA
jgi:two-component system NtrC family sensor kinase